MNTLRFNIPTTAAAGTPVDTAIAYVRLQLVLSSAFSATRPGWRTDSIVARQGNVHRLLYYTDFPWDSGALRVSAGDTDYLSVNEAEFDLCVLKGIEMVGKAVGEFERAREAKADYKEARKEYLMRYPNQAKIITTTYHRLPDSTDATENLNINDT